MKRYIQVVSLIILLAATSSAADTKKIIVNIGGVLFDVKSPAGFHEISAISPETRRMAETMTPPTNRLLGVFVSESDLKRVKKGDFPELTRYMLLQTFRQMENRIMSGPDFYQAASGIKKQQNTLQDSVKDKVGNLLDGATDKLSKEYDISMKMKMGEQIPLGIFNDQPKSFGFANLVKYQLEAEGVKSEHVVAGGTSMLLHKGKILFVYVYSTYKSKKDIEWVKATSIKWLSDFSN